MKKIIALICTMLAVMASQTVVAETITIATEGAYPPFNETNASGELIGFDVDIAKALCEKMQAQCTIVAQDWDGIIPGLVNNKYDAIIASMSITEQRLESIDFAGPYYANYIALIAKKSSGFNQKSALNQALGAQRSTVASEWAEDKAGSRGNIKLYDTQTAAYADLRAGRIDVLVSDLLPALDWVKDNPSFSQIGRNIDINDKIGIGIRKGDSKLKTAFDKALADIRADGTYQGISNKYFGTDIY